MASTLDLYKDSGLVLPLGPIEIQHNLDTIEQPITITFWLGSTAPDRQFHDHLNPGVNPLLLEIVDKKPDSDKHSVDQFKLAFTKADLAIAVAGAPLDLGIEMLSGSGNAIQIFMEAHNPNRVVGLVDDEIGIRMRNVRESVVGTPLYQANAA